MDQLRIEMTLKSPAILQGYFTLESLLAAAVNQTTGLEREEALALVPIARDGPIWHCSAVFFEEFDGYLEETIIRTRRTSEMGPDFYEPSKRAGKNGHYFVETGTGPNKTLFNKYQTLQASRLVWFAQADARKCSELLGSLHGVGKRRNQGYGEIEDVRCSVTAERPLIDARGMVRRPVLLEHLGLIDGAAPEELQTIKKVVVQHPFWAGNDQLCADPKISAEPFKVKSYCCA